MVHRCEVEHSNTLNMYVTMLERVQRKPLIKITSGYRTVWTEVLQVLAAKPPIDLLKKREVIIRPSQNGNITTTIREEEREKIINRSQSRWSDELKGTWTKRLIPHCEETDFPEHIMTCKKWCEENRGKDTENYRNDREPRTNDAGGSREVETPQ